MDRSLGGSFIESTPVQNPEGVPSNVDTVTIGINLGLKLDDFNNPRMMERLNYVLSWAKPQEAPGYSSSDVIASLKTSLGVGADFDKVWLYLKMREDADKLLSRIKSMEEPHVS